MRGEYAGGMTRPSVRIVTTLAPPPNALFRGFTNPDLFGKWFMVDWGERCAADVRVGGRYELHGKTPQGTPVWCEGEYEIVDAPNRIRFTFLWHGQADVEFSNVPEKWPQPMDVTLRTVEGGTEVTFVHEEVDSEASGKMHEGAWRMGLAMLADLVADGAA